MAMAQPVWLEGLSEEWVPEALPTPSSTVNHAKAKGQFASQIPQSAPPKPSSRLPRMRQSSGSFSDIQLRHGAKGLQVEKRRSALFERSLSDTTSVSPAFSADASQIVHPRYASQSFSAAASLDSVVYDGTVAQKVSPAKAKPGHDTPEWRRRLLKGDLGYGDQKDLFAPSGLQNIFQKPNGAQSEEKQPKRKLGALKGFGAMPSSPPPWPYTDAKEAGTTLDERTDSPYNSDEHAGEAGGAAPDPKDYAPQDPSTDDSHSPVAAPPHLDVPRAVSGQTEFENENFSPVYLSTNLKVGSAPGAIPTFRSSELAQRLRHLETPPQNRNHEHVPGASSTGQNREDSSFARFQDESLPEDLPAGTPDLADINRFVEMRRGGYSREGSFQTRPLSPSPQRERPQSLLRTETTSRLETEKVTQTTNDDQALEEVPAPKTPRRSGRPQSQDSERPKSSGSPLKLFDAHDTFTSNRLQRRLSQLEHRSDKTSSSTVQTTKSEVTKMVHKISRLTSVEEVSIQQGVPPNVTDRSLPERPRVGTFGEGQLNTFQFSGEFSMLSDDSEEMSAPDESPSMNAPPPGSRQPLDFHYDASPTSREPSRLKRSGLTRVANPFQTLSQSNSQIGRRTSATMLQEAADAQNEYAEGKRGPTSPFKDPTPKRRRTLQHLDEDEDSVNDGGLMNEKDFLAAVQSGGRKRKDARYDQSKNIADPDVLARRHILRPRNPTPSQKRMDEIIEATEAFIHSSPKMNAIREHIDPDESDAPSEEARAAIVANEVAAFSMKRQQMRDQSRKKSVTTQDFLDEAVKIMNFIRSKGRPTSGLGSLEESESESPFRPDPDAYPSISLTFDRPPSREGRLSAWQEPNKRDLDPEVMSHLRKYQEQESDDLLGSSFRSLRFSRMRGPPIPEGDSIIVEQDDIRITDNPNRHNQHPSTDEDRNDSQSRTNGTHPSTSSSMGQTIVTNTSRRSDHVATLAPEAVAHLIPMEVAGMSFDPQSKSWVRQKSPSKEYRPIEEHSATNESEDDPFGHIPDLSVDETAERLMDKGPATRPQATAETFLEDTEEEKREDVARPITRDGKETAFTDTSSASKVSNFAWSYPKTETRATSMSDQETRNGGTQKFQRPLTTYPIPESDEDDVEHTIKYFEGRGIANAGTRTGRVRDITISIAERDFADAGESVQHSSPSKKVPPLRHWSTANIGPQSSTKNSAWGQAPGAQTLHHIRKARRPMLSDDREVSVLDDLPSKNYRMQLSMSVSAPVLARKDGLLHAPSSPAKADVTFMLSDLPEFTLNQVDECELPDRVLVKHDGQGFSKALEDRYAQGTAELVKALQDVEPDEPYWEDLREVDLHDKNLTNLHRLDEFCYRLEELDVSNNNLDQVKGIPYTMRRLQAQKNQLTALTTWTTLMNLQHLDISGNDIDTLDGLSELVHLRTLKVNNNKVRSLDGILHLDGLIELEVAENEIEMVDFASAKLKSLTDVNLRGNRLYEVRNIHRLPQLQHLNLDDNHIEGFPLIDVLAGRCKALRSLRLCGNDMTSLNVDDHFPRLESLYVDRNSLTNVSGLEHLRYLRTFSAREQTLETDSDLETCVGNLARNSEVRSLYLSLNPTRGLDISQHLLNLQRLEVSSMGLTELPSDFGQLTPNIRSVNLNFNAIQDLRPLLNIKRLSELLVVGNKLERLRANALVLGKLNTLTRLDWRDNPVTMRFYPSASENRIMSLRQKPSDAQATDRFVLPDGDADADQQYLSRLDSETRIRRRVTEMMLANLCVNLRELDGLKFDKSRILVKDDIWKRLLELGVIQRKQPDSTDQIIG